MRKALLAVLAAAVISPSLAMAQTTTYHFTYTETNGTFPLAESNPATGLYGVMSFYANLAKDTAGGIKTCPDLSTIGLATFTSSAISVIKGLKVAPGDAIYGDGTVTVPSNGATGPLTGSRIMPVTPSLLVSGTLPCLT
jgi:hypothetical protein